MQSVRTLFLCAVCAVALTTSGETPAADTKSDKPAQQKDSAPATPVVTTTAPDSPLVAASKRANRRGKKPANVITNETLRNSRGHVTTTTVQRPIYMPAPVQSDEETLRLRRAEQERIAAAKAESERVAAAERERKLAAAAAAAEEGLYENPDDDPAAAEAAADKAAGQKPPQR